MSVFPRTTDLDDRLTDGKTDRLEEMMGTDLFTPWDLGLRIYSHPVPKKYMPGAYPVVRWTDRWGTRWMNDQKTVRKVTTTTRGT